MKIFKLITLFFILIVVISSVCFGYRDIPFAELKLNYAKTQSSFIAIKTLNVHYRDEGRSKDSIPIILLHGTGSSLHTFDAWAEKLKKDYRVIRIDLPGYGLTGPFQNRTYSTKHYVTFLNQFLKTMNIDKCILAGNSLGGEIAWNFTLQNENKVDKLILIDADGYPNLSEKIPMAFKMTKIPIVKNIFTFITPRFVVKSSIENVYADKTKITETLIDRYFNLSLRKGNRQAFIDRFSRKKDTTAYHNIKTIKQPTLIIWGEKDFLIPIEKAYSFHEDLPNSSLSIIKNTGHVPMEESPNESLKSVIQFLNN